MADEDFLVYEYIIFRVRGREGEKSNKEIEEKRKCIVVWPSQSGLGIGLCIWAHAASNPSPQ